MTDAVTDSVLLLGVGDEAGGDVVVKGGAVTVADRDVGFAEDYAVSLDDGYL